MLLAVTLITCWGTLQMSGCEKNIYLSSRRKKPSIHHWSSMLQAQELTRIAVSVERDYPRRASFNTTSSMPVLNSEMEATSSQSFGARYFGESSPTELRDLERNAKRATAKQMARAATYLQCAFHGQHYAWFGGWALKLRGSRRDTRDIDLLVRADGIRQVRAVLERHNW